MRRIVLAIAAALALSASGVAAQFATFQAEATPVDMADLKAALDRLQPSPGKNEIENYYGYDIKVDRKQEAEVDGRDDIENPDRSPAMTKIKIEHVGEWRMLHLTSPNPVNLVIRTDKKNRRATQIEVQRITQAINEVAGNEFRQFANANRRRDSLAGKLWPF